MIRTLSMTKSTLLKRREFVAEFRIGLTKTQELINAGDLKTVKIGRSTLITRASAEALVEKNLAPAKGVV